MNKEHDWRLQAVGSLSEDWTSPWTGNKFTSGSTVTLTSLVELHKGKRIALPVPNATASCLNISKNCWDQARSLRKQSSIDSSHKKQVRFKSDDDAINYLELMMQSVIFAFTALEAFVNEQIPDDYIFEKIGRKCTENYDKGNIERWLTIEDKLGEVLPKAISIESPKGRHNSWNELKKLKTIRDRLIHMKTDDRRSSGPEKSTIWTALMTTEPPYREAMSIISYFIEKKGDNPRWFEIKKSILTK